MDNELVHTVLLHFNLLSLSLSLSLLTVTMNWLAQRRSYVPTPINEECEYHTCNFSLLPSDDSDRGVYIVRGNLNQREPINLLGLSRGL